MSTQRDITELSSLLPRLSARKTHDLVIIREKISQSLGNVGLAKWFGESRQVKHIFCRAGISGDQQDRQGLSNLRDAA